MDKDTGKTSRIEFITILDILINTGEFKPHNYYEQQAAKRGVIIDGRRIRIILGHIYEMCENGILPFDIEKKQNNKTEHYRCVGWAMKEKDVKKLGNSVIGDETITPTQCDKMVNNLLDKMVPPFKRKDIRDEIMESRSLSFHNSISLDDKFTNSYYSKRTIGFPANIRDGADFYCYPEDKKKAIRKAEQFDCFVFNIFDMESIKPKLVLWLPKYQAVVAVRVQNMHICGNEILDANPKTNFPEGSKFKKYDEWETEYFAGLLGDDVQTIKILVKCDGTDDGKRKATQIINSFNNYYSKNKSRSRVEGDGCYECTVRSNLDSFKRWYRKYMDDAIIQEPKRLNNDIFEPLIGRYAERLKEFGE